MSPVKYIIFDFDGTIADTIDIALKIYDGIAPEYGCKPIGEQDWKAFRKRKLNDLLDEYGITRVKLVLLLLRMRKEMSRYIRELKPAKDMKESLLQIKNSGFRLGILTSNSKQNVQMFLDNNDLSGIVDFIYSGKSLFGKDKVMISLFDQERLSREEVIYVGDEIRDIEASRKVGIPVIAVSWGLSDTEVPGALQPDQIAHTPGDLLGCVQRIIWAQKGRRN